MNGIRRYKRTTKALNVLFIGLGAGMYGSLGYCITLALIHH